MDAESSVTLSMTAVVAAFVFVLTQAIHLGVSIYSQRRSRKNLAKGIYSEICSVMQVSGLASSKEDFEKWIENATIDEISNHTLVMPYYKVYEQNVSHLGMLPSSVVSDIVLIYFLFNRMNVAFVHIKKGNIDEYSLSKMKDMMKETVNDIVKIRKNLDNDLKKYL
ncbi:hypothetical protein [Amorphus sp. 3PC139-8]|uniref:hypothetical protein n=1 Tax=Amorphus sp. 3PC139-8 TaxID=2735676 RepID=UPI00345D5342